MHTDRIKAMGLQSRRALLGSLYFEQLYDRTDFINDAAIDTATWVLGHENFVNWSKWSFGPGSRSLLWIKGKPGSGKSILMKKTLSNVKLQNSALGLFQTLIHVLLTQDKSLVSAFIPVYRKRCAAHEGQWKWHEEELREFFKLAYSGKYPGIKNAVVMIDALDEVRSKTYDEAYRVAQDLVHFFKTLTAHGKLKVCLSSRHFPNIRVADCDQVVVEDFNKNDIISSSRGSFPTLKTLPEPIDL
ncbi:hypothetical protein LZ31DRAFT_636209 [Colletotrichum somersetense]|nr:hypothetical protein LZ31DRAFT_636209 [Colletotrichum somersetense]